MSVQQKDKSFFSTSAGLVTGAAGVLTALVGLLGLATQLGWLGSKNQHAATTNSTQTTVSTVLGQGPSTTSGFNLPGFGGSSATTIAGSTGPLTVDPPKVTFDALGPRDAVVKVTNSGTAAISMQLPTITGVNKDRFGATPVDSSCSRLDAGRSCQIKVTFTPAASGNYSAVLVIQPVGAPAKEVPLQGSALL